MNILDFKKRKKENKKISMLTCYDYWSARILNDSAIDLLLVGDSLAMVMHGFPTTLPASVELMALHTAAVAKGAPKKFIVSDMPFLAHRMGLAEGMKAVQKIMSAGASAIKIEGAGSSLEFIQHVVESGVPVMGHLGLTPQSIYQLGGFRVQGKDKEAGQNILQSAKQLEQAGCCALVLECIPSELAANITKELTIPTIGIGAGQATDGQVLVLQDMLGTNPDFQPRFLRKYLDAFQLIQDAANEYHQDVTEQKFPSQQESYLETP